MKINEIIKEIRMGCGQELHLWMTQTLTPHLPHTTGAIRVHLHTHTLSHRTTGFPEVFWLQSNGTLVGRLTPLPLNLRNVQQCSASPLRRCSHQRAPAARVEGAGTGHPERTMGLQGQHHQLSCREPPPQGTCRDSQWSNR